MRSLSSTVLAKNADQAMPVVFIQMATGIAIRAVLGSLRTMETIPLTAERVRKR